MRVGSSCSVHSFSRGSLEINFSPFAEKAVFLTHKSRTEDLKIKVSKQSFDLKGSVLCAWCFSPSPPSSAGLRQGAWDFSASSQAWGSLWLILASLAAKHHHPARALLVHESLGSMRWEWGLRWLNSGYLLKPNFRQWEADEPEGSFPLTLRHPHLPSL